MSTPRVAFTVTPEPIPVTCREIGIQLACDEADTQAEILREFALAVAGYSANECWPMQCRFIAEMLSDDECYELQSLLMTLVDHLQAIPVERREAMEASR